MGRSRYVILEPDKLHSMTCTMLEWFYGPETLERRVLRSHAGVWER
jgi:hypothetical protein